MSYQDLVKRSNAQRNAAAKASGTAYGTNAPRPLYQIAREIRSDWKQPYFGAVPYLDALSIMDKVSDEYGADSGKSVILYFLSNARTWRGPVATHIKAELKAMAGAS